MLFERRHTSEQNLNSSGILKEITALDEVMNDFMLEMENRDSELRKDRNVATAKEMKLAAAAEADQKNALKRLLLVENVRAVRFRVTPKSQNLQMTYHVGRNLIKEQWITSNSL